jgi:hypothetical protein
MDLETKQRFPEAKVILDEHTIKITWAAVHLFNKDLLKIFSDLQEFAKGKFHLQDAYIRFAPVSLEVLGLLGAPPKKRKREDDKGEEDQPALKVAKTEHTEEEDEKRQLLVRGYAVTLLEQFQTEFNYKQALDQADLSIALYSIQGTESPIDVKVEMIDSKCFKLENYRLVRLSELHSWLSARNLLPPSSKFYIDVQENLMFQIY